MTPSVTPPSEPESTQGRSGRLPTWGGDPALRRAPQGRSGAGARRTRDVDGLRLAGARARRDPVEPAAGEVVTGDDLFVDLLDLAVPAPEAARPKAAAAPMPVVRPRPRRRPPRAAVIVALVLVGAAAVVSSALVVSRDRHGAAPRPVPTPTVGSVGGSVVLAAESWLARNMSRDTTIVTDSSVAKALVHRGLRSTSAPPAPISAGDAPYVLSTAALRDRAVPNERIDALLKGSVPIAIFGTGRLRVELRQVAPAGVEAWQRERDDERADRMQAGRELLRNTQIRASGATRQALADGSLDLRAETSLALLAQHGTVRVVAIVNGTVLPESGLPARSVVVAADPAVVARTVATMQDEYQPSAVTRLPHQHSRLTWLLTPRAVKPVGLI
jgi:hypothetical protein